MKISDKLNKDELSKLTKSIVHSIHQTYAPELNRKNIIGGIGASLLGGIGHGAGEVHETALDKYKELNEKMASDISDLKFEAKKSSGYQKQSSESLENIEDFLQENNKDFKAYSIGSSKSLQAIAKNQKLSLESSNKLHKLLSSPFKVITSLSKHITLLAGAVGVISVLTSKNRIKIRGANKLNTFLSGATPENPIQQMAAYLGISALSLSQMDSTTKQLLEKLTGKKTETTKTNEEQKEGEKTHHSYQGLLNKAIESANKPIIGGLLNFIAPQLASILKIANGEAGITRTFTTTFGPQWAKNLMYNVDRVKTAFGVLGDFSNKFQANKKFYQNLNEKIKDLSYKEIHQIQKGTGDLSKFTEEELEKIKQINLRDLYKIREHNAIEEARSKLGFKGLASKASEYIQASKADKLLQKFKEKTEKGIAVTEEEIQKQFKKVGIDTKYLEESVRKETIATAEKLGLNNLGTKFSQAISNSTKGLRGKIAKFFHKTDEEISKMDELRHQIFGGIKGTIVEAYFMYKAPEVGLATALASGSYGRAVWYAAAMKFPKITKTLWTIYSVIKNTIKLTGLFVKNTFKLISAISHPKRTIDTIQTKIKEQKEKFSKRIETLQNTIKTVYDLALKPALYVASGVLDTIAKIKRPIEQAIVNAIGLNKLSEKLSFKNIVGSIATSAKSIFSKESLDKVSNSIKGFTKALKPKSILGYLKGIFTQTKENTKINKIRWAQEKAQAAWKTITGLINAPLNVYSKLKNTLFGGELGELLGKGGKVVGGIAAGGLALSSIHSTYDKEFKEALAAGSSPEVAKLKAEIAGGVQTAAITGGMLAGGYLGAKRGMETEGVLLGGMLGSILGHKVISMGKRLITDAQNIFEGNTKAVESAVDLTLTTIGTVAGTALAISMKQPALAAPAGLIGGMIGGMAWPVLKSAGQFVIKTAKDLFSGNAKTELTSFINLALIPVFTRIGYAVGQAALPKVPFSGIAGGLLGGLVGVEAGHVVKALASQVKGAFNLFMTVVEVGIDASLIKLFSKVGAWAAKALYPKGSNATGFAGGIIGGTLAFLSIGVVHSAVNKVKQAFSHLTISKLTGDVVITGVTKVLSLIGVTVGSYLAGPPGAIAGGLLGGLLGYGMGSLILSGVRKIKSFVSGLSVKKVGNFLLNNKYVILFGAIGAMLSSVIPVLGTMAGGILGGVFGYLIGPLIDRSIRSISSFFGGVKKKKSFTVKKISKAMDAGMTIGGHIAGPFGSFVGGMIGYMTGSVSALWDLIWGKKPKEEETTEKKAEKTKKEAPKKPTVSGTVKKVQPATSKGWFGSLLNAINPFSVETASAAEFPPNMQPPGNVKTKTYNVPGHPISKVPNDAKIIVQAGLTHVINDIVKISNVMLSDPNISTKDKVEVTKTIQDMIEANKKRNFQKVYSDINTLERYKDKYANIALVHNVTQAKQESQRESTVAHIANSISNAAGGAWNTVKNVAGGVWNTVQNVGSSIWGGIKNDFGGRQPNIDLGTPLQPAKYAPIAGSQVDFVKKLYPDALKASKATGFPVDFIIAQAGLETGWGRSVLKGTNNLFNIKAGRGWKGPTYSINALEYKNGIAYNEPSAFRVYGSYSDSIQDWVNFLRSNKRYSNLFSPNIEHNTKALAYYIAKDGYATDPNYANKIINTASVVQKILLNNKLPDYSGVGPVPNIGSNPIITSATGSTPVRQPIPTKTPYNSVRTPYTATEVTGGNSNVTPVSQMQNKNNVTKYQQIRQQQSAPKEQQGIQAYKVSNPAVNNAIVKNNTVVSSNNSNTLYNDYNHHKYSSPVRAGVK